MGELRAFYEQTLMLQRLMRGGIRFVHSELLHRTTIPYGLFSP